jgi:uncharacterized protein (DUF2236 family)
VYGVTPDALADELYADYARLGTTLDMPAELWPPTRAAFASYVDQRMTELGVTDDARQIAYDLFAPITAPAWLRAGLPLGRRLTLELLPPQLRSAYGFDWTERDQRRAARAWGVIRFLARITPQRLRSWPYRHCLKRLRAENSG